MYARPFLLAPERVAFGTSIAIHQPNFLPRLKVLQKLAHADVWCVLDSVQYNAREWQNRSRIVEAHGEHVTYWLSVPVHRVHGQKTLIKDTVIATPSSTVPLLKQSLFHAFRRAPHWTAIDEFLSNVEPVLHTRSLARLCVEMTCELLRLAGRRPTVFFSSSLPPLGKASTLIAGICTQVNSTQYIADSGARNYLKPNSFKNVEVVWQNWREPEQKWPGIRAWRDIASLNYLARVGADRFRQHLLTGEFTADPYWEHPQQDYRNT